MFQIETLYIKHNPLSWAYVTLIGLHLYWTVLSISNTTGKNHWHPVGFEPTIHIVFLACVSCTNEVIMLPDF